MSWVDLAPDSLLLTSSGWLPAEAICGGVSVAGVDRHGKANFQEVVIARTGQKADLAFLGTASACGIFAPTTRIYTSSGAGCEVREVISAMAVAETYFETVVSTGTKGFGVNVLNPVWAALQTESASSSDDLVVLRARGTKQNKLPRHSLWKINLYKERVYLRASKADMSIALQKGKWMEVADDLIRAFENQENVIEMSRRSCVLVMFLAASFSCRSEGYEIRFDSLQHTALIQITRAPVTRPSFGRGRCAHLIADEHELFSMKWSASSWNPLCNGFVLASA